MLWHSFEAASADLRFARRGAMQPRTVSAAAHKLRQDQGTWAARPDVVPETKLLKAARDRNRPAS